MGRTPVWQPTSRAATSLLAMSLSTVVLVGVLGPSNAVPDTGGFRWLDARPPAVVVVGLTWSALAFGALGVACGLRALAHGWSPSPRRMLLAGVACALVLAVLPVAGSTDALVYAQYGRLGVLDFDPAYTPPRVLAALRDPVATYQPSHWRGMPSTYGPLANALFEMCARVGGTSAAAIVATHKVVMATCFAGTALLLDRVSGPDRVRRIRAHLWWTLNPLMIWATVVAAHIDAVASLLLVAGLVAIVRRHRAPVVMSLAAGALLGAAAAVKAPYLLAGLGALWVLRRSATALAATVLGGAGVLAATYLWSGESSAHAVLNRSDDVARIYQWRVVGRGLSIVGLEPSPRVYMILGVLLAALLARRLPRPDDDLAAVRPMLVLSLAWLLTAAVWRPWYDALVFPLVALMPASALDGLLLLRAAIGGLGTSPGAGPPMPWPMPWLRRVFNPWVVSVGLLATFVAIAVWLASPRRRRIVGASRS